MDQKTGMTSGYHTAFFEPMNREMFIFLYAFRYTTFNTHDDTLMKLELIHFRCVLSSAILNEHVFTFKRISSMAKKGKKSFREGTKLSMAVRYLSS